ncbi:MAG: TRAP transporter small permease [Betaproteobacteria bacterium]|nr:TRAP transporter small permease [Betaproteobacteria bacterium]
MARSASKGLGLFNVLDLIILRVAQAADQLSAFICAFLIVVTTASVVVYQAGISIPWLDDVLRALLIWLVYMGCVPLALNNDHISMDAVYLRMPKRLRKVMDVIIALIGIGLCGFITKMGYDSMMQSIAYGELVPSGYFSSWPQNLAIPLGFGLMTVAYLSYLLSVLTGRRLHHLTEEQRIAEGS